MANALYKRPHQRGATIQEYSALLATVLFTALISVQGIGNSTSGIYENANQQMLQASNACANSTGDCALYYGLYEEGGGTTSGTAGIEAGGYMPNGNTKSPEEKISSGNGSDNGESNLSDGDDDSNGSPWHPPVPTK